MIDYNPKEWLRFIFNFHQADTFRKLFPLLIILGIYSAGVVWMVQDYWHLPPESSIKNITIMHSLLGFVISMLLVFRTNTAYDRWWEGRRQWGALVNASRGLAIKLSSVLDGEQNAEHRAFFAAIIPNYAFALKEHLRRKTTPEEWEVITSIDTYTIADADHTPNRMALEIMRRVDKLYDMGTFKAEHLMIMNNEIQALADVCGACERIRNTPIPFSYSSFLKKFIFFYVMTLPWGYVFTLQYLMIPVVMFIFYVLASLEVIAEEIESPFGDDANDLPLDQIATGIRRTVKELFDHTI